MTLLQAAQLENRDYITPEDVTASLESGETPDDVRKELCQLIGKHIGTEDTSLCCFIAGRA